MDNWDCLFCLDWYLIVFSACNSDGSLATGWHTDCEWHDVARSQISNQFVHADKDITFAETNTLLAASSQTQPPFMALFRCCTWIEILLPIRGGVKAEGRKDVWPDRVEADPVIGSWALIGQPLDGELQFVLNITCSHAHCRLMIAGHERIIKK